MMDTLSSIQVTDLSPELCKQLIEVLRKQSSKFRHIDKNEEPPLRSLDHGLWGESVAEPPDEPPPFPYMIRSGNLLYHGYRFDQDVCDEAAHTTEALRKIFGDVSDDRGAYFRQVLGYSVGSSEFRTLDDIDLGEKMKKSLLESALKVFREENNLEARKYSRMFSMYANLILPGQTVNLHLDVPEFVGVDRSKCPSWLLVAAYCSGLFTKYSVKNVTAVCYPLSATGGELAVFQLDKKGFVFPVTEGSAVVMNADSCFHHSQQARNAQDSEIPSVQLPAPKLPDKCFLEVEHINSDIFWIVKDEETKTVVSRINEKDIRFSISCKFHIFHDEADMLKYESNDEKLTAETIIDVLIEDLKDKAKLPNDSYSKTFPLYKLAPILVKEYILPLYPSSQDIQEVWDKYFSKL